VGTHHEGFSGGGGDRSGAAMGCSSSSSSVTVRASSSGALTHPRLRVATPWSPQAPPRLPLWRAAANRSSSAVGFGSCESKFGENRTLFMRRLVWTHRELRVLQILCINQTLIRLRLEDFWNGNKLGLVTIWKSNSRPG
jgi:hypothetical protein